MADCSYKFTKAVGKHLMPVYTNDKEKQGLIIGQEFKQGLFLHGNCGGLTTEDLLTDSTVEWLLEKEVDGVKIYAHCFEKIKNKKNI